MSRIPTLASTSTKKVNVLSELPTFPNNRGLRRRSKSMTELRVGLRTNPKKFEPLPAIPSKVAKKRTADPPLRENVPTKVIKKGPKVPSWDYKTRFQILSDEHMKLVSEFEEYKQKISELNEIRVSYNELDAKYNRNLREKEEIKQRFSDLQIENECLQKTLREERKECEEYKKRNIELINENKTLIARNEELSEELNDVKRKNFNNRMMLEEKDRVCQTLEQDKNDLQQQLEELKVTLYKCEQKRRQLHNDVQDLKGNIRVFCRLRPPITDDETLNQAVINIPTERNLEICKSRESITPSSSRALRGQEKLEFAFDRVFGPNANQQEVFEELSQLVQSALDGYHVCVFAYGQTGSGKTHTMQGSHSPEHLGMIPRSIKLIFTSKCEMERRGWVYNIKASFLEVYNEQVQDLLDMRGGHRLDIRFNEGQGTSVSNLTIVPVSTIEEFDKYMVKAQQNRFTAMTNYNEHSSRSHAVTKIYIEAFYKEATMTGSVSLVDLAGSESAKFSSNERLNETKYINKSLTSLGNVLMALNKKDKHIPYRDSKLTFLLQSCLGGNCKCLMIANISPNEDCYNETVNVLRFATKVKEVKTGASRNKAIVQQK